MISAHRGGEAKTSPDYPTGTWGLDTLGGHFYAEWDDQSSLTREGQQKPWPHVQGIGWAAQITPWSEKIAFPSTAMPKHDRDRAEGCFGG